ncbi:MAG: hypothetical protein PVG75_12265 [Thioalkalispiraceae bacterium]|jgi:hypothetical protein
MKKLKTFILGIIIGALVGLWVGINIGKDKPWYSNPFEDRTVTEKIKSSIGEGVEKAGESMQQMGEDIKGKMKK